MNKFFIPLSILSFGFCLNSLALAANTTTDSLSTFEILKKNQHWALIQNGTSCIEHYDFKSNGEVEIKSHLERITGTYTPFASSQNFELSAVVIHFETDNQQPDCMGNATNQAGTSTINFLKKESDQKIYFCDDALGKSCPVYIRPEH